MRADNLIAKLEHFVQLSSKEKAALQKLAAGGLKVLAPRQDLIRAHDDQQYVHLIQDGWACRYIDLEDGRRQIVSFLLPGDLCDAGMAYLDEADHCIGALTEVAVAEMPFEEFEQVRVGSRRLDIAMQWNAMTEVATARRWILNIGQLSAVERIAHLFCELHFRLAAVGAVHGDVCELPVTQQQLGEAMGLSSVHVNRSLQHLRAMDLIVLRDKTLTILDPARLQAVALFDPGYLHFGRQGREFDATD